MQKKELVVERDYLPDDKNFIYATWLKGLRFGNTLFSQIDQDAYFKNYQKVLDNLFTRPNVKVRVATLADDPSVILGYVVFEARGSGTTLHWAHTKESWRKIGIMKDLLPKDVDTITHLTRIGESIKPQAWSFNPFV